ncbi:amidohydrolase [Caldisalinibacter kiritimatiensis]|uniref:Exoenzymes regulatory protein AepA n=1 Tax=Caldisalinibacter kiritimatiensis TaxID=1304284 RepID=R1AUX9_9FIRM|nr:amidohydrolase [Caldisalinibacter kiritimatiensis]EOD00437.1 Exoenzymes regulatory protein AepA precursor [Caldisalinibacter kiritimatiensis]
MGSLLFYNGNILTMNEKCNDEIEAVVVKEDKIIYTGNYKESLKYTNHDTLNIDLKGRTLLPGFNDSHMHLISYGLSKYKVKLNEVNSIKELQEKLLEHMKNEEVKIFKDWVVGSGWNHENFIEKRLPTKEDLDKVISDRPMFLSRACYHMCVVNSKALELAGISKDTKDPEGGKIDRDPITGEPTGILRENAIYLVYDLIPFTNDIQEIKKIIIESIKDANKVGITSIQTDDFSHLKSYDKIIEAYKQLRNQNKLNARINLQMLLKDKKMLEKFLKLGIKTGDGDKWVRFGPLKLLADGSLGSRTAALEEPYSDDNTTNGVLIYSDEELKEIIEIAYTNGLQIAVHAIGDRCMNQVLTIYESIYKKYPKKDPRFRIIHSQICSEKILKKMRKLNVIADVQPIFIKTDMYMAEERIGTERMKWSYCWYQMLNKGIILSGGSDSPVEPFNPLLGIYSAVTRQDLHGKPKGGWYAEEKVKLQEALKIFTKNSAYCTYEEDIKGMIKEGMLADMVVLSDDITKISQSAIKDLKVDMTIVNGNIVYTRKNGVRG